MLQNSFATFFALQTFSLRVNTALACRNVKYFVFCKKNVCRIWTQNTTSVYAIDMASLMTSERRNLDGRMARLRIQNFGIVPRVIRYR